MHRDPVESSSLASVGYDPASRVLEVEFRADGVYQYLDVPEEAYRAFLDAESLGRHLNLEIKGRYDYRRV